jgi:hypothetical protein
VRHSNPVIGGLRVLALTLAVGGCAVQDLDPPKDSAPSSLGEVWRAPLVLRPGPVAVNMQAPARSGHSSGLGGEVFWLSVTALLTFGGPLLDLPNVVARHQTTVLDLPKECAESWVQVMNRPQWLGPSDARTSALNVLADSMKLDLERRGRTLTIEIDPTSGDDPRSVEALATIGKRHSAAVLAVADVLFSIEPQPKKCAMLMRVSASMHLEKLGIEPRSLEAVTLSKAITLSVTQWDKDPEVGTRALQDLLGRIGQDIISALPPSPAKLPAK